MTEAGGTATSEESLALIAVVLEDIKRTLDEIVAALNAYGERLSTELGQ